MIITWKALLRFCALLWFGNIIVILLIWWMVLPSLSHFYGPFTCVERHMVCNSFSLLHWFQNFPLSPLQYLPLGCLPILLLFPVNRKIVLLPMSHVISCKLQIQEMSHTIIQDYWHLKGVQLLAQLSKWWYTVKSNTYYIHFKGAFHVRWTYGAAISQASDPLSGNLSVF